MSEEETRPIVPGRSTQYAMARSTRKATGRTPKEISDKQRRTFGGFRDVPCRVGSVLQWDSTAGDVLVKGLVSGKPMRTAVLSCMDVGSRTMTEVAVIPREPRAIDLLAVLFRILMPRHFDPSDPCAQGYRYLGVPTVLNDVRGWQAPTAQHPNDKPEPFEAPAFYPSTLRTDGVASNTATVLRETLAYLQINLEVNRPANSTDGALIERAQRSLIPAYEMLPGYTANSPLKRGAKLDLRDHLTAEQLQQYLRIYAFTVYNQRPHSAHRFPARDKVPMPGEPVSPGALSPVAVVDLHLQTGGAIDLPNRPDLLYDLLPMTRLKAGEFSVTFNKVRYAGEWLEEVLSVSVEDVPAENTVDFVDGRYVHVRYDPRDLTRIWIRHPATGQVRAVPWMMNGYEQVPFSQDIAKLVTQRSVLSPDNTTEWHRFLTEGIQDVIDDAAKQSREVGHKVMQRRVDAAVHRYASSREDHGAIHASLESAPSPAPVVTEADAPRRYPKWEEEE